MGALTVSIGTSVLTQCGSVITPPQFATVLFWFFTYQPTAQASVTFCTPNVTLVNVGATVDIASQNLTQVVEYGPVSVGSNTATSSAGNITGAPLNGRAYNGIGFNLTNPDQFVLGRANSTQLQMPAAIFESAETSAEGLPTVFETGGFVQMSSKVYVSPTPIPSRMRIE